MQAAQGIIGGLYILASIVLIILAATRRNFPGKTWFIAFLAVGLATRLAWQIPALILRFDLSLDIRRFYEGWGVAMNLVGLGGFCLLIPFFFAVATPSQLPAACTATDVTHQTPLAGDTENPLFGIGGWLKFFVVVNMYIAPVLFGLQQIFAFVGFGMLAGDYPGLVVVGLIETAVGIFFVVKWIMIARRLRDMVPGVVQEAKRWLLITLTWNVLSTPLVFLSGVDAEAVMVGAMKGLITGVISFAIWYSYFNVSKRVKVTYGVYNITQTIGASMKHSILCILIFSLFLCSPLALAQNSEKETAAIAAAEEWLAIVDSGHYGQSWKQAADYLKSSVTKEKFRDSLKAVRTPLGGVRSRKIQSAVPMTSLPGAPDGNYVVIQFETSFENKTSAVETVTPMLEKNGRWRVSGYYIR